MAQKQLTEKLLDPDQAAHAAALDRLLRFIVFNDGCSWSSFAGHDDVVPYEEIYPDIVAAAVSPSGQNGKGIRADVTGSSGFERQVDRWSVSAE